MDSDFNKKSFSISALVLVVLAFGYWIYFQNNKVYEFAGNLDKIENGVVFASGYFLKNGTPIKEQGKDVTSIQIKVDNNLKITRLALNIPKDGKVFNVKDLKQEESVVNLEKIKQDVSQTQAVLGIEAKLRRGFMDADFSAVSLYFRVPVF